MPSSHASNQLSDWQPQPYTWLLADNYQEAINFYEAAIQAEPLVASHYWYLGLLLLLQGQEVEAQTTWLMGMAECEPDQIEALTAGLVAVLQTEAERREARSDLTLAWVIRQHIREIAPSDANNWLHLVQLSLQQNLFADDDFGLIKDCQHLLQAQPPPPIAEDLVLQTLKLVLQVLAPDPLILEFTAACLAHVADRSALQRVLFTAAQTIGHTIRQPRLATQLLEQYRALDPDNLEVLGLLSGFYQNAGDIAAGLETARLRFDLSPDLPDQVYSNYLILRALMTAGGYWQEAVATSDRHRQLLTALVESAFDLPPVYISRLFTASFFLPYLRDDPCNNRAVQNQLADFCQRYLQNHAIAQATRYRQGHLARRSTAVSTRPLRIGYLSHCLGTHSVGLLARWLLQYHDRSRFQLYGYFLTDRYRDPLHDWYLTQVDQVCKLTDDCSNDIYAMAERIFQDEIDILIDLDSITLDLTCELLSLKPAPIQATWLGWDASGLPTIDYFIADPYVLPEDAQTYYTETIWRLPQTYLAIDGFEVGVPTLRREQLDIPPDAVIFFSGQKGYKRHADTVRLQMQIVAGVPNSYFLIKGMADQAPIQQFFTEIALAAGVDPDRLRFLPDVASEATYRANLGIVDVVLDTYPYNGATTTLETLWMGIPLVTRVGQQFSARNSYTMMVNAGLTEGIAWTDAEYVEWGIRFGTDAALRQQVAWKLRRSRQTAPLWNAKQFTQEMEAAYEQMWELYKKS